MGLVYRSCGAHSGVQRAYNTSDRSHADARTMCVCANTNDHHSNNCLGSLHVPVKTCRLTTDGCQLEPAISSRSIPATLLASTPRRRDEACGPAYRIKAIVYFICHAAAVRYQTPEPEPWPANIIFSPPTPTSRQMAQYGCCGR